MINQSLSLKECLSIMNEMLGRMVDWDFDGADEVAYILIERDKIDLLKRLIPDERDLDKYLKDWAEDWQEYGFDISGVWQAVSYRFKVDIWVNYKTNRFYVPKWYHKTCYWFSRKKREIKYKIRRW